jgi:hypothetical protein
VAVERAGRILFECAAAEGAGKTAALCLRNRAQGNNDRQRSRVVESNANMETSPRRSALPTGFANVESAPITIGSGATTPAIRGDAKLFEELSSRRIKINSALLFQSQRQR